LEISETYPSTNFRRSTGSPAAILVNPGAQQGSDWGKRTLVICGPSSSTRSELFDLEGSSSRTSAATSRSASIASFRTWKDAASAARSDCLRRRKSARLTDASGSSFSAWPTPRTPTGGSESAERKKELGRTRSGGGDLQSEVRNWPTANARDWKGTYRTLMRKDGKMRGDLLPDAVNIEERGLDGPDKSNTKKNRREQLNPDWVDLLMGYPIGWTDCARSATP
jgi:hypothetical protein